MGYLQIIVLYVTISTVMSHLCLISPRQRGTMDISKGGSRTCTRHVEPCGGENIESPQVEYKPGESVFIKWQQNFNHYEPGYPGYMDIGIATSPNSTDFTTLAVVTDKYVHAQDYQENYTAIVKLPDVPCEHCVIRARYNAHKPGETPFLQCADIKITSSPAESTLKYISSKQQSVTDKRQLLPLKRALKLRQKYKSTQKHQSSNAKLYGFAYNPFEPQRSHYVSIETGSGKIDPIQSYNFGIDTPTGDQKTFLVDEVISIDYGRNTSNVLIHKSTGRDSAASNLYIIGTLNGSLVQSSDIFKFTGAAINALSWYTYGTSAALRITPADPVSAGWMFEVGILDFGGIYTKVVEIPKPENLYVNFQWLDTDVNNYKKVYALMGNENAPDELNARLYIFNLFNGNFIQYTELDVSAYTFMSFHSYPGSDSLFAFSPGLWFDNPHGWYLVAIDPMQGTVTKKCDIAPPGIFQRHYGGSVNQGSSNNGGLLYHVLRVEGSEADFLVGVNPITCDVQFSDVTNLRHIHSLQMPAQ